MNNYDGIEKCLEDRIELIINVDENEVIFL